MKPKTNSRDSGTLRKALKKSLDFVSENYQYVDFSSKQNTCNLLFVSLKFAKITLESK